MARIVAEAGDRAVDRRLRDVAGADAESLGHAWPEALEHDVGTRAESARERSIARQVAHDRLGARPERRVPRRRGRSHGIAVRRLDADDARAEARELAAGVRAGQVPREVDDERVGQRLHGGGAYLYPRAR